MSDYNPRVQLSAREIEELAASFNQGIEYFAKEEKEVEEEIAFEESVIKTTESKIKSLGELDNPGECGPDVTDYLEDTLKYTFGIWSFVVISLFIFHCILWLPKLIFDISWDTWGWTTWVFFKGLIGIGVCLAGAILVFWAEHSSWKEKKEKYDEWFEELTDSEAILEVSNEALNEKLEELEMIKSNRENILLHCYHSKMALPMRSFDGWNYKDAKKQFFRLNKMMNEARKCESNIERFDSTMQFFNSKLGLFFVQSMRVEAMNKSVYDHFVSAHGNYKNILEKPELLRQDKMPVILSDSRMNQLRQENLMFNGRDLDDIIDMFTEELESDTSGLFTEYDCSLLERQVRNLNRYYNRAANILSLQSEMLGKITCALGLCRLIAYRNIYLGCELVNIVRENAGGGTLKVAIDTIEYTQGESISMEEIAEFSSKEAVCDILIGAAEGVGSFVENVMSDKSALKYARKNPKEAAMVAAGVAAIGAIQAGIAAWEKRNEKVRGLVEAKESIIVNMESLVDGYLKNITNCDRALEITEAILEVNEGFRAIYKPLKKKVFEDKDISLISMLELQQLALALSDYKKLSESEL